MSQDIRIKKGLDLNLKGVAERIISDVQRSQIYTLSPSDFHTITPKLAVKEGDSVKAGEDVFYSKSHPEIKFVSPVSGKIVEIKRGEKRVILEISIQAEAQDDFVTHSVSDVTKMSSEEVKSVLLKSGAWSYIIQRPYDVIANPNDAPKSIFVSAYGSAPLAADFDYVLENRLEDFQNGLNALKKLTSGKVHVGVNGNKNSKLSQVSGVELHKIYGPHPAGNVGILINKIDPINAGEKVWVVDAQHVAMIGDLFKTGQLKQTKTIALAGSEVLRPQYYKVTVGAKISDIVKGKISDVPSRIINGDVLTGKKSGINQSLSFYNNSITVIPEGNEYRMFGWMPFVDNHIHSASKTSLSFLFSGKKFTPNTNLNGEERALVVTGEMEKVMPLDIFPMQLLKACLAGDIEGMENLGIYEVAPEDFGLIDYTNTSKLEAQTIIREALDVMIKEVG
jgi:Na+-transporting NADH:ubiquinone oxidoreductase subunit A